MREMKLFLLLIVVQLPILLILWQLRWLMFFFHLSLFVDRKYQSIWRGEGSSHYLVPTFLGTLSWGFDLSSGEEFFIYTAKNGGSGFKLQNWGNRLTYWTGM